MTNEYAHKESQRKGKNYTHGALHMKYSQELIHNAFNERRKMNACFSGQKGHEHLGEAKERMQGKIKINIGNEKRNLQLL